MKYFSRVALVVAMTASASSAFAMQAMTESDMSATTGQDGITVKIMPNSSLNDGATHIDNVVWHDKDGYNGSNFAGAVVMGKGATGTNGMMIKVLDTNGIELKVDADGGDASGGKPMLNVQVNMNAVTISTGDIWVAGSQRQGIAVGTTGSTGVAQRSFTGTPVKIMDTFDIELTGMSTNIQLGNEAQGHLISIGGNMTNGFSLSGIGITDNDGLAVSGVAGTGGNAGSSLKIGKLTVTNAGDTAYTMNTGIDVTQNGLAISSSGTLKSDILMENVLLGNTPSIGDVALLGVDSIGTSVTIGGH